MPRLARVVVPGLPHHVTQRGNRRQLTFFTNDDYHAYLDLLRDWAPQHFEVLCYCLMPNHVHLMVVPRTTQSLAKGLGEIHRRYTRQIHFRTEWRGYLWQGRFASFPMDEPHTVRAARYILLNPVRAGLAARAEDWTYSSARVHLEGVTDGIVNACALSSLVPSWRALLTDPLSEPDDKIRQHTRTGRPLGSSNFVTNLELMTGRGLTPKRPGRPRKTAGSSPMGRG